MTANHLHSHISTTSTPCMCTEPFIVVTLARSPRRFTDWVSSSASPNQVCVTLSVGVTNVPNSLCLLSCSHFVCLTQTQVLIADGNYRNYKDGLQTLWSEWLHIRGARQTPFIRVPLPLWEAGMAKPAPQLNITSHQRTCQHALVVLCVDWRRK